MDIGTRIWKAIQEMQKFYRAWKVGPGVVEPWEGIYGHDESTYSPAEYGDYLVTSNAVYSCSKLRANSISSVPIKAYKMVKGKRVEAPESPAVALLRKVNDFWTMNRLMDMTELSMCVWGRCFWAVERGRNGKKEPQEIWWMRPDRIEVLPDATSYIKGFAYTPINGQDPIAFAPQEVIWFRFPNPLDEYGSLSPMAAARLAADIASSAGKSNKKIFDNGYQLGGVVVPPAGVTLSPDQAKELEKQLDARFKGVDKAHRWGVLRFEAEMKQMGISPKDAEFMGALSWSLEEVCRAYGVPLDMMGGQRTYENVKASDRALWGRTMIPECRFYESELVEQFLPMFGSNRPDIVEFDLSKVPALQDEEGELWTREKGQIEVGAVTVNEWREKKGLDPVDWGDEKYAPVGIPALGSGQGGQTQGFAPTITKLLPARTGNTRMIEFGGDDHERLWKRFVRRTSKWQKRIGGMTKDLMERQRVSIIAKLKEEGKSGQEGRHVGLPQQITRSPEEPFDKAEWIRKFREAMREMLKEMLGEEGQAELDDLKVDKVFDVAAPEVVRFMELRAQRFAKEVNQTTWDALRNSLAEGLANGEGLDKLIDRVEATMGDRIASSGEAIARTEAVGAMNGGELQAYKQAGVVEAKAWLAALDERTRDSHIRAHERYQAEPIPLDEDFQVGNGAGPMPGNIGLAEEDVSCRCTTTPVVKKELE